MKEMYISSKLLRSIYKDADEELKAKLEAVYSKDDLRSIDITERIKTFEDACEELGKDDPLVKDYERFVISGIEDKHMDAYFQLCIITKALNEGWEWTFDELGHYPVLYNVPNGYVCDDKETLWLFGRSSTLGSNNGLACSSSNAVWSASNAYLSARLANKTEELALYSFKQFPQLWGWYLLNCEISPYEKAKE